MSATAERRVGGGTRTRVLAVRAMLGVVCALGALAPMSAVAVEAKPLRIARFEMRTLSSMSLVEVSKGRFVLHRVPDVSTQAGEHPWALATTFELENEKIENEKTQGGAIVPTRDAKDVVTDIPPGMLGNPQAVPACPRRVITEKNDRCPADTQVGVVRLRWKGGKEEIAPLVNVTPEAGQSAQFGVETDLKVTVFLTAHVIRSGSTYGLTVASNNIPVIELVESEVTFWGVPADPSHDAMRGLVCDGFEGIEFCEGTPPGGLPSGVAPMAFLTMPADCTGGPETATLRADSWEEPGVYSEARTVLPGRTGCELLQFSPSIEVSPDTLLADAPVALGVNLRVPQVENPKASGTPQLRTSVITFPEGMSISPGIVDGIQACNESGPEGINFDGPESEEVGLNGELQLAPGHCPDASIVGSAEAQSPLLASPVKGHVYLARPGCGAAQQRPCTEQDALDGDLYQLYLELGGTGALANAGVNLKVRLKTRANPATGQLTAVAQDTPQLPFSELRIRLNGGPRAPLDNPSSCGRATTSSDFKPWSAPGVTPEGVFMAGTPDAQPSSFFAVVGCGSPPEFKPGFLAGTVTPQAGQFSAFTLNLSRKDREQYVKGIQLHTPPGLLGMLASVPLCGASDAEAGTCGEAAKIGTTRVASGAGSHPFEIEGSVYLTGPYRGAPFGLSIVTHAVAGPFNLGLVVVRARIDVDPQTSTLTVTTDEAGPHAIPQLIFGVPLRLQRVTVDIDRPGFMFNPTNCGAQQQIAANISGSQGASVGVASPLAVTGCKSLAFEPKFAVSTSAKTSRLQGASLDVKLTYPSGSMGNEANIAMAKVDLPKLLPSRLTTLQKACPAATFAANPASCPAASVVGIVRAATPLLPVGLSGPVYFVSHGGEAFPSLIVVLQGDGVRVDLTGSTFISRSGITSSTFKTVPDVPVSSFELYLPAGRYSALAANGNLCKAPGGLKMPTEFRAQNGAVVRRSTKIAVTGCKKARSGKARPRRANSIRTGNGRKRK